MGILLFSRWQPFSACWKPCKNSGSTENEWANPPMMSFLEDIDVKSNEFEVLTVQLQNEWVKAALVIRNVEAATANAVATKEYVNDIANFLCNHQTFSEL